MTEQIKRGYFEICRELFYTTKGTNGKPEKPALYKCAKVRHTQYELLLWNNHNLPIGQVSSSAKTYFSESFLNGHDVRKADRSTITTGLEKLGYAVNSTKKRCLALFEELNHVLAELKLETIKPEKFLDFLTFNKRVRVDEYGYPIKDPEYHFEIVSFVDEYYLKQFHDEIRLLESYRRQMSMQDILHIIHFKQRQSVILRKSGGH